MNWLELIGAELLGLGTGCALVMLYFYFFQWDRRWLWGRRGR